MDSKPRVETYERSTGFPQSLFIAGDGRSVGTWIMGNDYRVKSGFYGGYPAGYLTRVAALFPAAAAFCTSFPASEPSGYAWGYGGHQSGDGAHFCGRRTT